MFRRPLSIGLFAMFPALAGCMHFVHKSPEVDGFTWRPADTVPDENKSCVYVFLIDPFDPFVVANTTGLRDFIQELGFGKTFYGQTCHASYFLEKMRDIRGRCANAKLVVIGYRGGADAARRLVQTAAESGTPIDLAIYLEPDDDKASATAIETNSFTIRTSDLVDPNAKEAGSTKSNGVRKSDVPTHPQTLALIERELTLVGLSVPPPPRPHAVNVVLVPPMPAPRNTQARPKQLPPDWQFMNPKNPWDQPPPPVLQSPSEPLPLPKVVPNLPIPKAKP